ncbi:GntR family transcriptional regulator/MocR family aminotransferase [Bradyrhizobium japonicum]|uniref:GntR family transcriptional regulator/MocR family aminotransferase n=1 Tax=Bradyrhizobium japonicum TaxID=375 RepID=A0ABV2RWL2_BRAJP|nr:PLP-dependent aminotransferase family protein [Bradyrhizobium japonicum]UQD95552.1 PLP-dependent aminotransferase family protein [Bradyrhizobium japonicum]WLB23123.1 PLP-dependent aminotransferase family protein [Bradyrhizobium japonicum]
MTKLLRLDLDRSAKTPLAEQIHGGIRAAIANGVLAPGARLPSWQDLAAQLGVARGTVRAAYEKLSSAQLIVASRATGTHVADRPSFPVRKDKAPSPGSFMEMYQELTAGPAIFQMGVPAQETFPATLLARMRAQAVRVEMSAPAIYPDPRGELELRREIAAYLALARGIECTPSQIIITSGFSGGLGLALRVLGPEPKTKVWVENPGFPFTRHGLALARLSIAPIPVDADGIDVDYGLKHASDAALVVVTPGQQAPLGSTLSLARRSRLLDWATRRKAWVIEDDYLSELQLKGRATPALASLDRAGRVIHIGSFSKTVTPALRLGFVVAPAALASRFAEAAACLAPAPGPAAQFATADFMREGHYLRHLRRTKRVYTAQGDALLKQLRAHTANVALAGLAAVLRLPDGAPDLAIAREAASFGLAPTPLSLWYASTASARPGLLLGIATSPQKRIEASCDRLFEIIDRLT